MSEGNQELFDAIRREHEELRELLGQIHHGLKERTASTSDVTAQMESLSTHIDQHFADEEREGYFEQVRSRAPRLLEQLQHLKNQHDSLRESVRSLQSLAEGGDGSAEWWEKMDEAFHGFSKDLMHHENSENELVQEAYTEDIGTGD